jgi:hypothetical protein
MKTINYKGNTYQIGAAYEFSHDGIHWIPDTFFGIDESCSSKFESHVDYYKYIRVCKLPMGTITPTPIELIDGKAYQFTNVEDNTIHGIYSEDEHSFNGTCVEWPVSACTNIQPLTVEIK